MADIVQETLSGWIEGADDRENRVRVFERVRDIPYAVVLEIRNLSDGPREILKRNCGSCTPKHFLLGRMFELMGIDVRYVTFPFSWNQPRLSYPPALRMLAEALPAEYHLALHARIDNRWTIVDATWDAPLAKHGFPVNESWNGTDDLRIALEYQDMIVHERAEEREAYVKEAKTAWRAEDNAREAVFVEKLNAWLASLRDEKKPR